MIPNMLEYTFFWDTRYMNTVCDKNAEPDKRKYYCI